MEYITIITLCLALLAQMKICRHRVTDLFIVIRQKIYQSTNHKGRKILKEYRNKVKNKDTNNKYLCLSKCLIYELQNALNNLDCYIPYTTNTHLKSTFKLAERQGKITILSISKGYAKPFILEALPFLGFKEIIKLLLSKNRRLLFKKFYNIKFIRIA